jgi:hypothetical protein
MLFFKYFTLFKLVVVNVHFLIPNSKAEYFSMYFDVHKSNFGQDRSMNNKYFKQFLNN